MRSGCFIKASKTIESTYSRNKVGRCVSAPRGLCARALVVNGFVIFFVSWRSCNPGVEIKKTGLAVRQLLFIANQSLVLCCFGNASEYFLMTFIRIYLESPVVLDNLFTEVPRL